MMRVVKGYPRQTATARTTDVDPEFAALPGGWGGPDAGWTPHTPDLQAPAASPKSCRNSKLPSPPTAKITFLPRSSAKVSMLPPASNSITEQTNCTHAGSTSWLVAWAPIFLIGRSQLRWLPVRVNRHWPSNGSCSLVRELAVNESLKRVSPMRQVRQVCSAWACQLASDCGAPRTSI